MRVFGFSLLLAMLVWAWPAFAQRSLLPTESNIVYGTQDRPDRKLDIYLPGDSAGPFPVVLMFHGSGGSKGDLEDMGIPQLVVPQGYAAVSATYTTRPASNLEDAYCALAWVYANAATYALDTEHIALYGISYGGYTAALLAAINDPSQFSSGCPNTLPDDYDIDGVISQSGVYFASLDAIIGAVSPDEGADWSPEILAAIDTLRATPISEWRTLDLPPELAEIAALFPVYYVDGNEPPHLIVHGWGDNAVPIQDALDYANLLVHERVNVVLVHDRLSGHVVPPRLFDQEMIVFLRRIFA